MDSLEENFTAEVETSLYWKYFEIVGYILLGFLLQSLLSQFNLLNFQSLNSKAVKPVRPELLPKPPQVPTHIAVIMDGNRRYGRKRHADPLQGHWVGGQTLVNFVNWCMEDGVKILTVYAFSTENWNRDIDEVNTLMMIISKYAESFKIEAVKKNIQVKVLCTDRQKLPLHVQNSINELEESTKGANKFLVNICLSYGGRADITQACKRVAEEVSLGNLNHQDINEAMIQQHLLTNHGPEVSCSNHDPDILIRTSGEYRISNFLLWQSAYTEMFFISKYWPEVTRHDLREIMHQYCERNRRFGK